MLLPKVGLPAFLLTGAPLLVILTSHVFRVPDHAVSERNGAGVVVPFTVPQLDTSASKVAVPFGSKATLHESLLNVISVDTSHHKRDQWSDAVAEGRRLYATILSHRTFPSPYFAEKWLTGSYPEDSKVDFKAHSVGWQLYGQGSRPGALDTGSDTGSHSSKSDDGDDADIPPPENETPEGYEEPFGHLQIPLGDKNENWIAYQDLDFANCYGSGHPATGGVYGNYYNVPGKTIVASYNFSPAHRLKQHYQSIRRPLPQDLATELPFVTKWSDATWIIWSKLSREQSKEPGNLKHVFRHYIITASTKDIIAKAVDSQTPHWPGRRFTPNDDQYMALLATAHGKGVFNLLTQHPAEFGSRNIESITVFTTAPHDSRDHLLFTFTD